MQRKLTRKGMEWNWTDFQKWKERGDRHERTPILIRPDSKVFGVGSCFAENVVIFLKAAGVDASFFPDGTRFYDALSIAQTFRHVLDTPVYSKADLLQHDDGTWCSLFRLPFRSFASPEMVIAEIETADAQARERISNADVLIITTGGAEIWRDRKTKRGFVTIPPPDIFNRQMPDIAEVHNLSVAEHLDCYRDIVRLVGKANPKAQLVFTISPHRMTFSVAGKDVVEATSRGKAVIKAALSELIEDNHDNVHYFPSYEMVNYAPRQDRLFDHQLRHVNSAAIEWIMNEFMSRHFSVKEGYQERSRELEAAITSVDGGELESAKAKFARKARFHRWIKLLQSLHLMRE